MQNVLAICVCCFGAFCLTCAAREERLSTKASDLSFSVTTVLDRVSSVPIPQIALRIKNLSEHEIKVPHLMPSLARSKVLIKGPDGWKHKQAAEPADVVVLQGRMVTILGAGESEVYAVDLREFFTHIPAGRSLLVVTATIPYKLQGKWQEVTLKDTVLIDIKHAVSPPPTTQSTTQPASESEPSEKSDEAQKGDQEKKAQE